eukprot:scaffold138317_cov127-Phaeocystis_antarctica.AAC.2
MRYGARYGARLLDDVEGPICKAELTGAGVVARRDVAVREEHHEHSAAPCRRRRLARRAVPVPVRAAIGVLGGRGGGGGGGGPFLGLALG